MITNNFHLPKKEFCLKMELVYKIRESIVNHLIKGISSTQRMVILHKGSLDLWQLLKQAKMVEILFIADSSVNR